MSCYMLLSSGSMDRSHPPAPALMCVCVCVCVHCPVLQLSGVRMRVVSLEGELNQGKALQEAVEKDLTRVRTDLAAVSDTRPVIFLGTAALRAARCTHVLVVGWQCMCLWTARHPGSVRADLSAVVAFNPTPRASSCLSPVPSRSPHIIVREQQRPLA
jgi:hypothetical protein